MSLLPDGSWRLFFFNDPATTEIYTLSLHDALPIYLATQHSQQGQHEQERDREENDQGRDDERARREEPARLPRRQESQPQVAGRRERRGSRSQRLVADLDVPGVTAGRKMGPAELHGRRGHSLGTEQRALATSQMVDARQVGGGSGRGDRDGANLAVWPGQVQLVGSNQHVAARARPALSVL